MRVIPGGTFFCREHAEQLNHVSKKNESNRERFDSTSTEGVGRNLFLCCTAILLNMAVERNCHQQKTIQYLGQRYFRGSICLLMFEG